MERNPHFARLAQLVEMAETGLFDLPAEILAAHTVARRLADEQARPLPARTNEARQRLVEAFVRAAAEGGPWPDGREVLEAEATERAEREAFAALDRAASDAQGEFVTLVDDQADEIIVGSLRPTLTAVIEKARRVASALAPHGGGVGGLERLLTAPKAAREAWLQLDTLAGQYAALRRARGILVRGSSQLDQTGLFAEIRNLHELWPSWRQRVNEPWPSGSRERLLWLARPDVQVWMPTPAQQEARYREAFAEGMAAVEHARAVAAGGRAPLPV